MKCAKCATVQMQTQLSSRVAMSLHASSVLNVAIFVLCVGPHTTML